MGTGAGSGGEGGCAVPVGFCGEEERNIMGSTKESMARNGVFGQFGFLLDN